MNSSWVTCISLSSNSLDWNRVSYVLQSVDSAWLPVTAAAQWNSTLHLNASTGIGSWITYVRWGKTCVWRYSVKIDKCIWKIDMKWAFELQCNNIENPMRFDSGLNLPDTESCSAENKYNYENSCNNSTKRISSSCQFHI